MTTTPKKAAGVLMSDLPHYLDHLGVICHIMGVPLLCMEAADKTLAKKFYPGLQVVQMDYHSVNPEYLISHYDAIFNSDLWDEKVFDPLFKPLEDKYKKRFRVIYCPHGFSDKGFYLAQSAKEDAVLIYGQNMLDQMAHHGLLNALHDHVITGNYRLTYYKEHQDYYDNLVKEEILSQFGVKQQTLLYAPTWVDSEDSSSFFRGAREIFLHLPDDMNMIVKLHPHLESRGEAIADYYRILGEFENKPNIIFLREFPPVYPLLAVSDIYLGDMSSIGYDFLTFNRPMFFLNMHKRDAAKDRGLFLFRCGVELTSADYSTLYDIIKGSLSDDKNRFGAIRQEVYDYTFGKERALSDIRSDIEKIYS